MDLNRLIMDTDVTLATFVIVGILAALVMGAWQLAKSLTSKDRVALTSKNHAVDAATPRHDMRTLTGVHLEAGVAVA